MPDHSPKARFDALAALLAFDAAAIAALREGLSRLSPKVGELIAAFDAVLKRAPAHALFADLQGERRDALQSLAASLLLRTVNCNFDEAYCDYLAELAARPDVPAHFFEISMSVTEDFVVRNLPGLLRDEGKLAASLSGWSRLISILKVMLSA